MSIYDIAGASKPATPMTALNLARQQKSQRRLMEAQALVMETNVANADREYELENRKVGVQEAGVGIQRQRNQIDANEFGLKYEQWREKQFSGMSEDQQRAFSFWEKAQATGVELYEQAKEQGASEEEAIQMGNAPFARMQAQLPENMRRQQMFDPNVGAAIRSRDNQSTTAPKSLGQRVVTLPGGKPTEMEVFIEGDQTYVKDAQGNKTPIGSGQMQTPTQNVRTGAMQSQLAQLDEVQINTKNYIDAAYDAYEMIENEPDANTAVAGLSRIANDLQTEAMAFARQLGFRIEAGATDASTFERNFKTEDGGTYKGFGELGITNARMKSLIVNLAFQKALASQQSGRDVSNADVARFIEEIGANHAKPQAFKAVLKDTAIRMDRNFRNRYDVIAAREGVQREPVDFGLDRFGVGTKGGGSAGIPEGVTPEDWEFLTPEERKLWQ